MYFLKGNVFDIKEDLYFVNLVCYISLRFGICVCVFKVKEKIIILYFYLRKIVFVNVDLKKYFISIFYCLVKRI